MSKELKEYSVPFRQILYYAVTVRAHDADEAESLAWDEVPEDILDWCSGEIEPIESMIRAEK